MNKLKTRILMMLLVGIVVILANTQENDSYVELEKELNKENNTLIPNDEKDAQIYAKNMNVSVGEALRRFHIQDIAGQLDSELSAGEAETFAGLWIEHTPEFKIVVRFTRDGEKTIKPYISKYPELSNIIEVRDAKVSLVDLQKDQANALSSLKGLNMLEESDIDIRSNSVKLYIPKAKRSLFDAALRSGVQLPDTVRVITIESPGKLEAEIYGGLPLTDCTSGFAVKKKKYRYGWIRGITTAGHCSNTQSYNGINLKFRGEKLGGSYDIQWHTPPREHTVKNKIRWWEDGSTRDITAKKSRDNQVVGGYVCKYGMTTHYTCGYISSKNFAYQGSATYIRVDNTAGYPDLSSHGDSGGPWFLTNTAYGTHVGSPGDDPNDAVYMAVNYVESGLGVVVMTSS